MPLLINPTNQDSCDAACELASYEVCTPVQTEGSSVEGPCPVSFELSQAGLDSSAIPLNQNYAAMMQTEAINPFDSATCSLDNPAPKWQESIVFAVEILESGDFTQLRDAREALLTAQDELLSAGGGEDSEVHTLIDTLLHQIAVLELSIMGGNINGLRRSITERQQTAHGVLDSDGKMGFTQLEAEGNILPPVLGVYEAAAQLVMEEKVDTLGEAVSAILNLNEDDLDPNNEDNFAVKYGFSWSQLNQLRIHVQDFRKLQQDAEAGWVTSVITSDPLDKQGYLDNAGTYREHGLYSLAQYNYDLYFHNDYVRAQGETSFEEYIASLNSKEVNSILQATGAYEAAENLFGKEDKIYAASFGLDLTSNVYTYSDTTYADLFLERLNNPAVTNSDEDAADLALIEAAFAQAYNKFIQKKIADHYQYSSAPDALVWKAYDDDLLLTSKNWYEFHKMTASEAEHFWRMLPIELATLAAGGGLGGAAGKGVAKHLLLKQLAKKGLGELAQETLETGGMKALYALAERELGVVAVNGIRATAFGAEAEVFSVTTNFIRGMYTGDLTPITDLNRHFKAWGHSALMLGLYKIGGAAYRDTIGAYTQNLPAPVRLPADLVGSTVVSAPVITGGEVFVAGMQGHMLSEAEFADLLRGHIVFSLGLGLVHAGTSPFESEAVAFEQTISQNKKAKNEGAYAAADPLAVDMHAGPDFHPLLARMIKWVDGDLKAVEPQPKNTNLEAIGVTVDNLQYNLSAEAEIISIGKKPGEHHTYETIRISAGSDQQCWLRKVEGNWYLHQSSTEYTTTVRHPNGEEMTLPPLGKSNMHFGIKLKPGINVIKVGEAEVALTIPGEVIFEPRPAFLPPSPELVEPVSKTGPSNKEIISGKVSPAEAKEYVEDSRTNNPERYAELVQDYQNELESAINNLVMILRNSLKKEGGVVSVGPRLREVLGAKWSRIVELANRSQDLELPVEFDISKIKSFENQAGLSFESDGGIQVKMPQIYLNIASDPNLNLGILGRIITHVTNKHHFEETIKELQRDIHNNPLLQYVIRDKLQEKAYNMYNGQASILGSRIYSEANIQKMDLPPNMEGVINCNVHGFWAYLPYDRNYLFGDSRIKIDGRLYITIKPEKYVSCVGGTVNALQLAMKESNGAFWFKVLPEIREDGSTARRDQIVVYFNHENQAEVLQSVQQAMGEVEQWHGDVFSDAGPYFTAKIREGLFFGQEPYKQLGEGLSFGELRANVLKETKEEVRRLKDAGYEVTPELELAIAAHLFSLYEIDPEHPAFNTGGAETFDYIYENVAPDQGSHVGG